MSFDDEIELIRTEEDKRNLFLFTAYQRDIIDGKGNRDIYQELIQKLYDHFPETTEKFLENFSSTKHACFHDLLVMQNSPNEKLSNFAFNLFAKNLQIEYDQYIKNSGDAAWSPGLIMKWAPREGKSFGELAVKLAKFLFPNEKRSPQRMKLYRQFLSAASEKTKLIEHLVCQQKFDEIDFDNLSPSARKKYSSFFMRDELKDRYRNYIQENQNKIRDLPIYELVNKILNNTNILYESLLINAARNFSTNKIFIPIVDLSRSMEAKFTQTTSFKDLAISLAFTISQSPSSFTDTFITFNDVPIVKQFDKNDSIPYKLQRIAQGQNIGMDIYKTMDLALKLLLERNVLEKIYLFVFTDEDFEQTYDYEHVNKIFSEHNLQTPGIVYWNLNPKKYKKNDPRGITGSLNPSEATHLSGFNKEMSELFFKGDIDGMKIYSEPSKILEKYRKFYPQI